jgi:hypothetical protein
VTTRSLLALLVAVLVASAELLAQDVRGSVAGVVVDARTGQPLSRARVSIIDNDNDTDIDIDRRRGRKPTAVTTTTPSTTNTTNTTSTTTTTTTTASTTTDAGRFVLSNVPVGPARIEVSLVGYGLARREVNVPGGGLLNLTIPLSEGTATYTEEVRVAGPLFSREEPGVPSQMSIGSAELQNLRSLLADDPMRAVQTLPGVGGSDDFRSDFSVRASDVRHVGVTLDGVPSPLLVHTVRHADNTGSLAMINSDVLDRVSLLAGSYPQRHGNRTGAEVNFRTRDGSRDKEQVRLSVSAINASIVAEGPLGQNRRGSWLISGRKSYIDWLIRTIDPETTGTFGFVDAQGKAVYDLTPRHTLQFNMVAGRSRYDEHADDPGPNSLETGVNRSVLAGVALRSSLSPTLVATQRVYTVFNRFTNRNDDRQPLNRGSDDDLSYRADVTAGLPRSMLIESGVHVQRLHAEHESFGYGERGALALRERFSRTRMRLGGYALTRLRPLPMLTVSPGVRLDRWDLTGETKASPWMQAELVLPRALLLTAGSGVYRQAPDIVEVDGPQGALDPRTERARHVDVGLGQQVGPYRWQLTVFSRGEADVLRLPDSEPRLVAGVVTFPDPRSRYENTLSGSARGAELMIERRSANGLSGWIGYGLASAEYEDSTRRESFPADAEQRHTLNLYAHYRLTSRTSVSGRFRAATNTPLVGYLTELGGGYVLTDVRNRTRLPVYSRLDVRGNRTFDLAGGRLTLFVEIINAYNRRNLRGRESFPVNPRTGAVRNVTEKLFPIVPSVGFLLEF